MKMFLFDKPSMLYLLRIQLFRIPVLNKILVTCFRKRGLPKVKAMGTKGKICFEAAVDEAIEAYSVALSQDARKRLHDDIILYYLMMSVSPSEYFLFSFHDKNNTYRKRKEFVSRSEKDRVMIKAVGLGEKYWLLHNKYCCYNKLKKYFGRDAIKLTKDSVEDFIDFCKKKETVMTKPIDGSGGGSTFVIKADMMDRSDIIARASGLLDLYDEWIIEELIEQDEKMACFNESSVNTVRIFSYMNSTGFGVFDAVFRMGRAGSVVDNASSGGIVALVDVETGIVSSDAIDKHNNVYTEHPDSHRIIKGFQIPAWMDLLLLVEMAHKELPQPYPYVGWDFAYSTKGWVIVEANWGHILSQEVRKEGIRSRFYRCFE